MRFFLPLLSLLFLPIASMACSCAFGSDSAIDRYLTSDLVAVVEIENVEDVENEPYYKAYLRPIELYKGKIPAFVLVQGRANGENHSARCEISIKENEKWLLYLNANDSGEYQVNLCSFPVKINEENNILKTVHEQNEDILSQLKILAEQAPEMHMPNIIHETSDAVYDFLQQNENIDVNNGIYLYLITFDAELNVQSVEPLRGINSTINKEFELFLKTNSTWSVKYRIRADKSEIKNNLKYIVRLK